MLYLHDLCFLVVVALVVTTGLCGLVVVVLRVVLGLPTVVLCGGLVGRLGLMQVLYLSLKIKCGGHSLHTGFPLLQVT